MHVAFFSFDPPVITAHYVMYFRFRGSRVMFSHNGQAQRAYPQIDSPGVSTGAKSDSMFFLLKIANVYWPTCISVYFFYNTTFSDPVNGCERI